MKSILFISIFFFFLLFSVSAQNIDSDIPRSNIPWRRITIEPAIGLELMSDINVSTLEQFNLKKRLSIVSYSSYSYNNALQRDFNYIKTNYNYSISQKFGVGTSLYTKHSSHTFSLMAGIRYDAYKETLENPDFEKVSGSLSSFSPDLGVLYNLKIGKKKYFFSYRMYIPLYPYPVISSDIWSLNDNLVNLSFEFGLGIRLK